MVSDYYYQFITYQLITNRDFVFLKPFTKPKFTLPSLFHGHPVLKQKWRRAELPYEDACLNADAYAYWNSYARFCLPKVAINILVASVLAIIFLPWSEVILGILVIKIVMRSTKRYIFLTGDIPNEAKIIFNWTSFYGNKNMNFGFGKKSVHSGRLPGDQLLGNGQQVRKSCSDHFIHFHRIRIFVCIYFMGC